MDALHGRLQSVWRESLTVITKILEAILNKSCRQHPTKQQLYSHLSPIRKTIPVSRTKHMGHSWRSKDELINDILLWTPLHERAKAGRLAITYIQPLCVDTGCSIEDLLRAMDDRDEWRERIKEIRAGGVTWWLCVCVCVCVCVYVLCLCWYTIEMYII